MTIIARTGVALSMALLLGLSCAPLALAQHNDCTKGSTLPYCQNVGKDAFCQARNESRYGKIVGVSWQHAGAPIGRYRRPLSKDGYCYIIVDEDKKILMPVGGVVAQ